MTSRTPWPTLAFSTITTACLLVACGGGADGGIGSGGTGNSPSNGVAVGTVGGFGSIFVGGVRCDDTRAKISLNTATGAPDAGTPDIKLGQRVQLVVDPASATCKILQALVEPEVVGIVSNTAPLTVAGQRILINTDASIAPPTVIDGFADAASIAVGDRVEVHGEPVTVGGVDAIRATRIERKPVTDTWVRARGVVANLSATQFTIGGLTVKRDASTRLDPADLVLANGQTVIVWSTAPVAGDGSITAGIVRSARRALADQQAVRVEGAVAGCTATPCTTPTIDGLSVDLSGASFVNGSAADVANGVAMRVEGSYDSVRSKLVATKASIRLRDLTAGDVTLIGMVSDFVSSSDFSVRGVPVTTTAGTTVGTNCTIAPGQIVGIKGQVSASTGAQVVATQVDCLSLVDGTTLDIFGGLINVDTAAKTFNMTEGPFKTYTLTWNDDTVFGTGVTAATLASGLRVGLRAVLVDGKLLVKRMIADPVPTTAPTGVQLFGNFGIARDVTATSITVNRITMNVVPGSTTVTGNVVAGTPVRTWFYRTGPLQPWTALQVTPISWN